MGDREMRRMFARLILSVATLTAASCSPASTSSASSPVANGETQYLAFQVFTGSPDPHVAFGGEPLLGEMPSSTELDGFARSLIARMDTTGRDGRRLALIFGPLSFDHTDEQVASLIGSGFDIALARDVAVGFHIDDSMFWGRRRDLLADPRNVERMDWDGPLSTGRRLAWGPRPSRAPPHMCINSAAIEAEVWRRGDEVIGAALHAGLERLRRAGREDLFAGVIVGWETQIGREFESGRVLGYCALANRGLRRGASREAMDQARVEALEHFISIWSTSIASAGVPPSRIYSHVAFMPRRQFDSSEHENGETYAARTNFSPPETAFGRERRAGFSTYPEAGIIEEIHDQVRRAGGAPWASAEGANVALGGDPSASGMATETYLARLFNRGAALVNIFGWGIGDADNGFRRAAESPDAIAAYRKFLRGEALIEGPITASILERLPVKIHRIHAELPQWVRAHNGQARAQPHVEALDAALAAQDWARAEAEADALLALMVEE